MKTNNITKDWVLKNFDIDKERRTLSKTSPTFELFDLSLFNDDNKTDLCDLLEAVNNKASKYTYNYAFGKNARVLTSAIKTYDPDDISVVFWIEWNDPESDEEVIKRIMRREKAKLTRSTKTGRKSSAQKRREEEQLKLYKKLHKKFGNKL